MPHFEDMINGHEWRKKAEYNQRVAWAAQNQNLHLGHALYDSHSMLREQQERASEANRRTARRSFQEGYGAAMEQVRRDMALMSMAYQTGHRDGRRDSRRQMNNPAPNDSEFARKNDRYGAQYGPLGSGSTHGRGGDGVPPPGYGAAPPPWPPRQGSHGQAFQEHGHGGSGTSMPQRARSPPNHGRRIGSGRPEWQQQMPDRRRQWRRRADTVHGSENDFK